ncbi:MAG: hypothetical protein ACI3ZL_04315 [Candidatus Cryptobacteroides sp.]
MENIGGFYGKYRQPLDDHVVIAVVSRSVIRDDGENILLTQVPVIRLTRA